MKINNIRNLSFKSLHKEELERVNNHVGYLCHQSAFFRYDQINGDSRLDEFIITKNVKKAKSKPPEIVSVGCSYGEEPYSYALAYDSFGISPKILGIDSSEIAIDNAKNGEYCLYDTDLKYLKGKWGNDITDFQKLMQKSFEKNFEVTDTLGYWYGKKPDCLNNCDFEVSDGIEALRKIDDNSKDIILCRFVLYHCNDETCKELVNQAYRVLKPNGIFSLNQIEYHQYQDMVKKAGFVQSKKMPCVFKKPSVIREKVNSILKAIKN